MNVLDCVRFKAGVTRGTALGKVVPDLPEGVDFEALSRIWESGQTEGHP